jgi:predicted DsbA family dithiol-disulfide isomerase
MTEILQGIPLKVDIVSDVVCPWCIIGYKQLQKALDSMSGVFDVTIRWHPFELNPRMPEQGQNLREHISQKYGSTAEQSKAAKARMMTLGESLGFTFDYFDEMRMVNTFRAHQLLYWAGTQGRQTELELELFEAFFSLRQDVSDGQVLAAVAGRVGLPVSEALAVVVDGRYAQAVREEQKIWLDKDVHAVPAFLFNEKYMVPGAQEAETFVRILNKMQVEADL